MLTLFLKRCLVAAAFVTVAAASTPLFSLSPVIARFDLQAVASFTSAIFFGPAGILGAALAIVMTTYYWGIALTKALAIGGVWVLGGSVGYLGFRFLPSVGRRMPYPRSYLALVFCALLGTLITSFATARIFFPEMMGSAFSYALSSQFISIIIATPLILILASPKLGRLVVPMPGDAIESPSEARSATAVDPGSRRGSLRLLHILLVVGITLIVAPVVLIRPDTSSWLTLLYTIPILSITYRSGLRGGVVAASGSSLVFLIGTAVFTFLLDKNPTHSQTMGNFAGLAVLCMVGVVAGGLQEYRMAAELALRKSEERLRLSQKLESIGLLAGGIAHDFNNILTVIHGQAELLKQNLDPEDSSTTMANDIVAAAQRAASLTRQLLAFSRKQVLAPVVLDLNALVENAVSMLRRVLAENIEISTSLQPDTGSIRADANQVEQIVLNLAANARDAMPQGGQLRLTTSAVVIDKPTYFETIDPVPHGRYAKLTIRDTGVGMSEQTRKKVFEPFFTTKEASRGTGLGLATVYGFVKQSGGYIDVSSVPGKGSNFDIYFPSTKDSIPSVSPSPVSESTIRGTETILLVEDESGVRDLAKHILEEHGYLVIEAKNGLDALEVASSFEKQIHLVLTDIIMPELDGRSMVKELVGARPGIVALFMSGYPMDSWQPDEGNQSIQRLLSKPFSATDLLLAVRHALDT